MRAPRVSPELYRRITLIAAILLGIIIVTGGAVRVTNSGLGCPSWPNCSEGRLAPHSASDVHGMIEYVNRLFTGLVSVTVILAVLASWWRTPRRRDLLWLSWGLVAGVFGQAVLGGLTVLFELQPEFVMAHFLVSIVLLSDAIVLYRRAGQPDAPSRRVVTPRIVVCGRALLVLAAAVLFTGTVVTGSGPHSGGTKEEVVRLGYRIEDVARIHSGTVIVFLAAVLVTFVLVDRDRAPRGVVQRLGVLLVVLVAQAGVGYAQYFHDIPAFLVGVHIAGATLVWTFALWFHLGLSTRDASRPIVSTAPLAVS